MPTGALLGGVIRWALTILVTFLLTRNVIDKETADKASGNVSIIAGALVGLLIPLAWSFYTKLRSRFRVNVALALPPGANRTDVDNVVANSTVKDIISTEPNEKHIPEIL